MEGHVLHGGRFGLGRDRLGIDTLVGTFPILTSIGAVVGEAAAVYLLYLRYGKDNDETR